MANVNNMNFNQVASILNELNAMATGQSGLAPTTEDEWVSVAQKTVKNGYDPLLGALTQVIGRTIFSIRPYSRKFSGIQADAQRYGAITRKISISDKPFEDDNRLNLVDGQSLDMYKVNKPNVLQMNYYGFNQMAKTVTIFRDQLDSAMQSSEQFGQFLSMVTTNVSDMVEQSFETLARGTIGNFIAGKVTANNGVIHLLTEYNTELGLSEEKAFTRDTVMRPENFKAFAQWAYGKIQFYSRKMSERSGEYQIQVQDHELMRHTDVRDQKVYLSADFMAQVNSRALADTFHDSYLKQADNEQVTFWQDINTPRSINVKPTYLTNTGDLLTAPKAVRVDNILGVIFDRDALGYTVANTWSGTSPLNINGGYWNTTYHYTLRYWNDFTEKGIILLLD